MSAFPARLHVLIPRRSPHALVIRRGPSRQVATYRWDRRSDTFELGQWMRGRIYERRCDLSPDGRHLLYFAMNGRWESETKGAWSAISRAPYLKAIALFPKGDCWNGGGLWTDERRFWLNDGFGHEVLFNTNEVERDRSYQPPGSYGGECPHVYYNRLQRDGWTMQEDPREAHAAFEKELRGGWRLRKLCHADFQHPAGKGPYWDEHRLLPPGSHRSVAGEDWEWAEWRRDRLLWAKQGCLYAAPLQHDGPGSPQLLMDFNPASFQRIVAPY